MRVIKILLILVLIAAIGSGAYYVAFNRGWLDRLILPEAVTAFSLPSLPNNNTEIFSEVPSSESLNNQVSILSSRVGVVGGEVGQVLGSTVQAGEQPPLHERAIERVRYVYCQEVVKDYESRYSPSQN